MDKNTLTAPNPKDWSEDFSHENGNYICICCKCNQEFRGNKRRVVCRTCSNQVYKTYNIAEAEDAGHI